MKTTKAKTPRAAAVPEAAAWPWWTAAGLLLLASQGVLLGLHRGSASLALAAVAVLAGIRAGVGPAWREALTPAPSDGLKAAGSSLLAPGLSALALLLTLAAAWVVPGAPGLGLAAFVLAGLALAGAAWRSPSDIQGLELPAARPRLEAWEIGFVAVLALVAGAVRFHALNTLPMGAHGHEGEMAGKLMAMADQPYVGHVSDGDILWPSLSFYQGLGAIHLLGFSAGHLRLPAAILAFLSLFMLYMLARRLTSPGSAAVATVLYAGNIIHQGMGRNLFPGAMLFIAPVAGFYFLLVALDTRRAWPAAVAGLAAGLSLHAFVPGRTIFALFAGWMGWLWLSRRRQAPSRAQTLWFWGAFILIASPVLWWAAFHWDNYWAYVSGHNPNVNHGPFGYVYGFLAELPTYARAFHVQGDPATVDMILDKPFLDPFSGALFGTGLFFCLAFLWRPLPFFTVGLFFLGVLPAIMGGGFAHPTARRLIMCLPAVYLMAAVALERLRLGLSLKRGPASAALVGLLLLAATGTAVQNTQDYFAFLRSPRVKGGFGYAAYLSGQAMLAHPQSQAHITVSLVGPAMTQMLIPPGVDAPVVRSLEDLFTLSPGRDHLLLLDGYYEAAEGLLRLAYPHALIHKDVEPAKVANNYSDPTNPYLYLMTVEIPKQDVNDLQGLSLEEHGQWRPAGAFQGDFLGAWQGKRVKLRGVALGALRSSTLKFTLGLKGWSLSVDGRPAALGRDLALDGGAHSFTLEGPVPAHALGGLPLTVTGDGIDLHAANKLLGLPPIGVRSIFHDGARSWDQKTVFTRHELAPIRRYYDITELTLPYSVRFEGRLRPAQSGRYSLDMGVYDKCTGIIRVGGKVVFDSTADREHPVQTPVDLKAGAALPLVVDYVIDPTTAEHRTQVVYIRPEGGDWGFLPADWVEQP